MLQAVMTAPGQIEFNEVPIPEVKDSQVLVRIRRIGVCGSDIHVYHGKHPYTTYPVVQGHEVCGEIVKVAADVTGLKPGDTVTIQPQLVCEKCYPCRNGRYNICEDLKVMGFQTTGMASEYFAVDAKKVLKLPEGLSFDLGAMIEPLAVAVRALRRAGDINDKKVLVLGAGPIGNLVAQSAKGMGASEVMITDISEYRLEVAKQCMIDHCINSQKEDVGKVLIDKFGRDKADVIFECVGIDETMDQAINIARKGSDIIVVGVFPSKGYVDMGLVQDRELRLIGTLMYREEDYIKAIELVQHGKVNLEPLISNHFTFRDYKKAYEYIQEKGEYAMKVIITLD